MAGNTRPTKGTKIEGKLKVVIKWVPRFTICTCYYFFLNIIFYIYTNYN